MRGWAWRHRQGPQAQSCRQALSTPSATWSPWTWAGPWEVTRLDLRAAEGSVWGHQLVHPLSLLTCELWTLCVDACPEIASVWVCPGYGPGLKPRSASPTSPMKPGPASDLAHSLCPQDHLLGQGSSPLPSTGPGPDPAPGAASPTSLESPTSLPALDNPIPGL